MEIAVDMAWYEWDPQIYGMGDRVRQVSSTVETQREGGRRVLARGHTHTHTERENFRDSFYLSSSQCPLFFCPHPQASLCFVSDSKIYRKTIANLAFMGLKISVSAIAGQ